jgi:hypothetical protein
MAFFAGILAFICFYMLFNEAGATGTKPHSQDQDQKQYQDQAQDQAQDQSQTATADAASSSASDSSSSSSNDGNQLTVEGDSVENNSSNVVLVPNNNTESCLRVWGIAFGKNGESAALGIPWRSKQCDFEQAADDAFAAGERELGWFWKCQNKSLYRIFRLDGMSDDEAKLECHKKSVGMNDALKTIDDLKRRLDASEEYVDYLKSHQKVCDESLERCEEKAYGSK